MKAELSIEFTNKKVLEAVNASLLPDNINFPEGMKLTIEAPLRTRLLRYSREYSSPFSTVLAIDPSMPAI